MSFQEISKSFRLIGIIIIAIMVNSIIPLILTQISPQIAPKLIYLTPIFALFLLGWLVYEIFQVANFFNEYVDYRPKSNTLSVQKNNPNIPITANKNNSKNPLNPKPINLTIHFGHVKRHTWDESNSTLADYEANDMRGWRMPTIEEMQFIFENRHSISDYANDNFWINKQSDDDENCAWYCNTKTGHFDITNKKVKFRILAVRDKDNKSKGSSLVD